MSGELAAVPIMRREIMKTLGLAMALCLCGILSAGAQTRDTVPGAAAWEEYDAVASLVNPQGEETGQVIVVEAADGLLLRLQAHGLPPGWHAFHLHQSGKCEAPSFESAGDHYEPEKHPHGLLHKEGPHAGDLPNIYVPADGKVVQEIHTERLSLRGEANILDADGSAFIIHEKADDYLSQPSGAAGDRIACGVAQAGKGQ
jgi:superoxide dismutase, Cu-Zn family